MSTELAPLLTKEIAEKWFRSYGVGDDFERAIAQIASGRVVCIDTATHVAVPKMTEEQAREKWETTLGSAISDDRLRDADWGGYLAALRDAGVIK